MKPVDNSGDEAYPSLECCEREERFGVCDRVLRGETARQGGLPKVERTRSPVTPFGARDDCLSLTQVGS